MKNLKDDRLVWVDMEMSGLDISKERILEIAVLITDHNLDIISEGPVLVIKQNSDILDYMDKWNTSIHNRSGLVEKVKKSELNENDAEIIILDFLKKYVVANTSPLCGNTVHQDRSFMKLYMPNLENFFHYRNLDVSSIKEVIHRWYPNSKYKFIKQNKHEALADIYESIEELKFYKKNFFI
ncbi:MAG: oligoribonuclease [Candidatus Kinetoplastibacterium crithidii]|nr:MAG: oligoribonuclease [Candidatus Kinetoplastibacterium crithidii]